MPLSATRPSRWLSFLAPVLGAEMYTKSQCVGLGFRVQRMYGKERSCSACLEVHCVPPVLEVKRDEAHWVTS